MNVLQSIREFVNSPQNAAQPSGSAQIVVQPQSESAANIANEVNSGAFGPPSANSPMDRVKIIPRQIDALAGVPHTAPEQDRAYDEDIMQNGYDGPPKDVIVHLQEMDAPVKRLQAGQIECSRGANGRRLNHLASIALRTAEGDATVALEDAWTLTDWEADARERIGAFKTQERIYMAQAWELAEPFLIEKAAFLNRRADELEATARLIYDRFHFTYSAPSYILGMRKYAESLTNGSRKGVGLPSQMLTNL
jgi:hypothetical protein